MQSITRKKITAEAKPMWLFCFFVMLCILSKFYFHRTTTNVLISPLWAVWAAIILVLSQISINKTSLYFQVLARGIKSEEYEESVVTATVAILTGKSDLVLLGKINFYAAKGRPMISSSSKMPIKYLGRP